MLKNFSKSRIMNCQVQAKYEGLRREVSLLESKKESLEKEIFGLHATLVQYRTSYQEKSALIDTLHQED